MLREKLFEPTVSPLLRNRKLAVVLLGATLLQLGLFVLRLPGWECPFLHAWGVPCPGCGLTRAVALLLHGDLRASLSFHVFAPVFLLAFVMIGSARLLPEPARLRMIAKVELLERRTGITVIVLGGLVLYWLARLLILQSAFVQLIRG